MAKVWLYGCIAALITISACKGSAQELVLADNNNSEYKIIIPADASKLEKHAASVLQDYVRRVSGVSLPISNDNISLGTPAIYIGHTTKEKKINPGKIPSEGSLMLTDGKDLVFYGGSGKGLIYGVYGFIEKYLHCRKISNDPAIVTASKKIVVPGHTREESKPQFIYREVYYPACHDAEYVEWNQLQQFEDLWGLWGHSYDKLVPAKTYFKPHPEYYALVKGTRQATQLCLSNEDVYKIVVDGLKTRMAANPDGIYWSVSPNDDIGYCECDKCKAANDAQGSPSGSLIQFVNRVAATFPDKTITTLAYGFTHRAPKSLKPASNVCIFLSDIDAYRDKPLLTEGSASAFRNDVKAWAALTPNLFVWDYITEFTNYLAPFPNFRTLQPNMQFFVENGVKGVFAQGSGDTYSEWAELRSYLTAKLLANDKADINQLTTDFLNAYYGPAAIYMQQYKDLLEEKMLASHRKLDIYGNPVNEWNSYLSPEFLDQYSVILDNAEAAVENNPTYLDRVVRARLPLEYTVLQQARFYGIEKFGVFVKERSGDWAVKPKFTDKITRFVANCKKAGVTELSEGGLTPDQYQAEWDAIVKAGVTPTKATDATVTLQYPFAPDFPAKGNRTLVDGSPGYNDFSYNWLCFYGVPMVATIDLGRVLNLTNVKMHFLDDPRHWIFLPEKIIVEISADGMNYHSIANITNPAPEEHYNLSIKDFNAQNPQPAKGEIRYIRVTANNLATLPEWRSRENKKPMIACDEIYVQ
jgi:hypothetical protein